MLDKRGFDLWADGYDQAVGISDKENTYPFAGYRDVLGGIFETVMQRPDASVLDIGTGTGLIALMAAQRSSAEVVGVELDAEAAAQAVENVERSPWKDRVSIVCSAIQAYASSSGRRFDRVVSNPPYICDKERTAMEQNVLEHEPHTALFVPDDDPLLFYRTIAQYGQQALKPEGWLYFEINPLYANDMQHMLSMLLYRDIELKTDQFGKQRMIRAMKGKR